MTPEINTIGIIGAGQMGTGIAQVCALAGIDVRLNDLSDEKINAGLANIDAHLARDVSRGAITDADRHAALERIRPAPSFEDFAGCDLIIEAASENEAVKRQIFQNFARCCGPRRSSPATPPRFRSRGS